MNFSKAFTRREKILLLILALLMVFASYYLAIFRPTSQALADISTQQTEADAALLALEEKAVALEQMRAELLAILDNPNAAEIPSYNNLQRLMAFLNTTLSSTKDYDISFQTPELPNEEGGIIVRRTLTMAFGCFSYEEARSVVDRLHDGPYLCQVQDLSIVPSINQLGGDIPMGDIESFPVQVTVTVTYFEILE